MGRAIGAIAPVGSGWFGAKRHNRSLSEAFSSHGGLVRSLKKGRQYRQSTSWAAAPERASLVHNSARFGILGVIDHH
jgi:hypothetical protein